MSGFDGERMVSGTPELYRTVRAFDPRAPGSCLCAAVGGDAEALRRDPWDPHEPYAPLRTDSDSS